MFILIPVFSYSFIRAVTCQDVLVSFECPNNNRGHQSRLISAGSKYFPDDPGYLRVADQ